MKRNLLIVFILVLIGGGFIFMNSNTDFFKGFTGLNLTNLPGETEDTNEFTRKLPFEDNHFIDFYLQSRRNEYNDCVSNIEERSIDLKTGYSNDECEKIRLDAISRKEALESLFNLDYYDKFRAKKVNGKWIACDDGDYSDDCQSFKELGYSKDFFHDLFGLEPYENKFEYPVKSSMILEKAEYSEYEADTVERTILKVAQ